MSANIAIVSAGVWSTSLAIAARRTANGFLIWEYGADVTDRNNNNENNKHLPNRSLDTGVFGDHRYIQYSGYRHPNSGGVGHTAGDLHKEIERDTRTLMSKAVSALFLANQVIALYGGLLFSPVRCSP
tara:strand:- start:2963 stop:3346 length:384 start_codon:yes stop_codon:yes gene_type:complete